MNRQLISVRLLFVPLAGIAAFVVLYIVAAKFYPGGSDADRTHSGFDWMNNYWCDLVAPYGKNGVLNTARPVALTAMIILFSALAVFWLRVPHSLGASRVGRLFIGYTGLAAMLLLVFLFTDYHDAFIFAGGALSSIPFAGILRELYRKRRRRLFALGCCCAALILLNFYSYLTGWLVFLLPLVQKITLTGFLAWTVLVDLNGIALLKRTSCQLNEAAGRRE